MEFNASKNLYCYSYMHVLCYFFIFQVSIGDQLLFLNDEDLSNLDSKECNPLLLCTYSMFCFLLAVVTKIRGAPSPSTFTFSDSK